MKKFKFIVLFCLSANMLSSQTWHVSNTSFNRQLYDSHINSIADIIIVGGHPFNDSISYMTYTNNGGESWNMAHDIFPGRLIRSVLFFDADNGLCVGDRLALFETNNAGVNWTAINIDAPIVNKRFNKITRSEDDILYIAGGQDNLGGILIRANSANEIWELVTEREDYEFYDIYSHNSKLFIVGSSGLIEYSMNSGLDWQGSLIENNNEFESISYFDIEFATEDIGYCSGGLKGADSVSVVLKTVDGGFTWEPVYTADHPALNDIAVVSENLIYAVGDKNLIIYTNDGGNNWLSLDMGTSQNIDLYSVNFKSPDLGVITGKFGYVYIFREIISNISENCILFLNENLTVYPNPFTDNLKVSFNSSKFLDYQIEVYNNVGEKVFFSNSNQTQEAQIYTADWSTGVYTLRLTTKDTVREYKILKQ